jgi:hypothetical protein
MSDLTEADYGVLFATSKDDMPRIWRVWASPRVRRRFRDALLPCSPEIT